MRMLIIEDEPHWQQRIREIADASDSCEIVSICSNLAEGMRAIRNVEFDVLIVDLGLPDGSGNDAIRAARRSRPDADILVATVFDDERSVVSAICAGATGYIVKDSTPAEWISAMTELRAGHSPISPKIARHILRRVQVPGRREAQSMENPVPPANFHARPRGAAIDARNGSASAGRQGILAGRSGAHPPCIAHHDPLACQEHLSEARSEFEGRSGVRSDADGVAMIGGR